MTNVNSYGKFIKSSIDLKKFEEIDTMNKLK